MATSTTVSTSLLKKTDPLERLLAKNYSSQDNTGQI
jgi:hypothetical protein